MIFMSLVLMPEINNIPTKMAMYTRDVPKSGCKNTSPIGTPTYNTGNIKDLNVSNLPIRGSSILAIQIIINNLENSDG